MLIRRKTMMSTVMHDINIIQTHTNLVSSRVVRYNSYTASVVCDTDCEVYLITIKMGTTDITSTAWDAANNVISIENVTDTVSIECYAMHTMPSDYIRVDGIKNPSNAYVNTEYIVTPYSRLEVSPVFDSVGTYPFYMICGRSANATTKNGSGLYIQNSYLWYMHDTSQTRTTFYVNSSYYGQAKKISIDYYTKTWAVEGTSSGGIYVKVNNDDHYTCLFSGEGGDRSQDTAGKIIKFAAIYDHQTNAYVRYYIPCLNANGVAGFWDAARGVFQGSRNSTAFEACYTQRGLVFQLDGINKGATADAWTDLVGGIVFNKNGNVTSISDGWNFPRGNIADTLTSSENPHNFDGKPYTVEVCFKTTVTGTTSQILIQMPQSKSLVFAISGVGPFTFRQGYKRYYDTLKKEVGRTVSLNNSIGIADGIELATTTLDSWNTSSSYIKIGSGDSTYAYKGDIYAIRIYDVNLTKDEILLNQRMDNKRFNLGLTI